MQVDGFDDHWADGARLSVPPAARVGVEPEGPEMPTAAKSPRVGTAATATPARKQTVIAPSAPAVARLDDFAVGSVMMVNAGVPSHRGVRCLLVSRGPGGRTCEAESTGEYFVVPNDALQWPLFWTPFLPAASRGWSSTMRQVSWASGAVGSEERPSAARLGLG